VADNFSTFHDEVMAKRVSLRPKNLCIGNAFSPKPLPRLANEQMLDDLFP
jgi:hypothetical protein